MKDAPNRCFSMIVWLLCALFAALGCAVHPETPDDARTGRPGLESLASAAEITRSQIQAHLSQNPDSELRESLRVLDSILEYAAMVKADPDRFDAEKTEDYSRKIQIVQGNIQRFKDPGFRVSVSFTEGSYRIDGLPARDRRKLQDLVETVAETVADLQHRYPTQSIRITLKSIGYTDENPIAAGTRLEAAIRTEIDDLAPVGPARRRQYNQILSRLRATNVNQFALGRTRSGVTSNGSVEFVQKISGMGESLPAKDARPPYRPIDARRRVCLLSAFVEIVL